MRIQILFALGLALSLSACQKKYSAEQQPKSKSKVNLNGMSVEKLVRTKYENLRVVCNMNGEMAWSTTPISLAQAEWNILQEFGESKTIQFASDLNEGTMMDITVHLDRLAIMPSLVARDENGGEYLLKNTPVVQARVSWRHRLGNIVQNGATSRIMMFEGLRSDLLSLETAIGVGENSDPIKQVHISCQTAPSPKPEYLDEFSKR